jgi:hypothetical protein
VSASDETFRTLDQGRYLLIPRPAALSENPYGSNWRSYWEAPHAYRLWAVTLCAQGPEGQRCCPSIEAAA